MNKVFLSVGNQLYILRCHHEIAIKLTHSPKHKPMSEQFFDKPILNSPYEYPARHWELDEEGQPTQRILDQRREAKFVTPIPKPRRRRGAGQQDELVFGDGRGLSTQGQQYDVTGNVNEIRRLVDAVAAVAEIRRTGV